MRVRRYNKNTDERKVMQIISKEDDWEYDSEKWRDRFTLALEKSITYVACEGDNILGFSRSINDCDMYVYLCDLLVDVDHRGKSIGKKLIECLSDDFPGKDVYVMSDADGYYSKQGYKKIGSIFELYS